MKQEMMNNPAATTATSATETSTPADPGAATGSTTIGIKRENETVNLQANDPSKRQKTN
jgi:hypothetical protein